MRITNVIFVASVLGALFATTAIARADDDSVEASADTSAAADADIETAEPVATSKPSFSDHTTGMCIDKAIADRLAVKRIRRGVVERLYVKQARHEISVGGGYYASDLYSGTYVLNASYAFHMTEQTAVEFGGSFTHSNADVIRAVESDRGRIIDDAYAPVWMANALLIWSPMYGKLRFGGAVIHFDVHLDAGVGVVDDQTSRGIMGVGGIGFKLFAGKAMAFRIDARNHTYQQELLDEHFIVNDATITAGISLLLPFRN